MIKLALIDNGIPYHMRNNRNQRIVHKSFLASKCDPSEYKDDKSFHGAVCVGIITSICSDIELWDIVSRGFVYVRESEDLMDGAREVVENALDSCLERNITDWGKIKTVVKDALSEFLWKRTKRSPMILPIIMEA